MYNSCTFIGRLGKMPETRFTADGTQVTTFSIATDEQWKDKNGEKVQKTEWIKVVTFGKLAEICGNFLTQGKLCLIVGKMQTRSWEDKDGVKRYTTEIVANTMKMLSPIDGAKKTGGAHPLDDGRGPDPSDGDFSTEAGDVPF